MTDEQLSQLLGQLSQKERQQVSKDIVDTQIRILSVLYDKSIAYTNLIIIAGYASFFGMWAFTRGYLSPQQALWSALIMSISIVTFVFFEVIKMTVASRHLLARSKAISDLAAMNDPNIILSNLREFDLQSQKDATWFGKLWIYTLIVTVGTAVIAIVILFFAFISSLIEMYA